MGVGTAARYTEAQANEHNPVFHDTFSKTDAVMNKDAAPSSAPQKTFDPQKIERPDPVLLKYYALVSLAAGPLFPFAFIPLLCKYITLRYQFEADGVSMKWGVLFRREINLTHRRIQDIHLTNNIFQRWMGLANVAIQTASGSAAPEMTIEGVLQTDSLRDYLYAQMRGAKGLDRDTVADEHAAAEDDSVLTLLTEIRDNLRIRLRAEPGAVSAGITGSADSIGFSDSAGSAESTRGGGMPE